MENKSGFEPVAKKKKSQYEEWRFFPVWKNWKRKNRFKENELPVKVEPSFGRAKKKKKKIKRKKKSKKLKSTASKAERLAFSEKNSVTDVKIRKIIRIVSRFGAMVFAAFALIVEFLLLPLFFWGGFFCCCWYHSRLKHYLISGCF